MRTKTYTTLSVSVATTLLVASIAAAPEAYATENGPQIGVFTTPDLPTELQTRLFLPRWVPNAGLPVDAETAELATANAPLALREREVLYPLVPLPPALQSMAALGSCVVAMRCYRRIRRHLRVK